MEISRRELLEGYWTATSKTEKELIKPIIEAIFSDMHPTKPWTISSKDKVLFRIKAIHE